MMLREKYDLHMKVERFISEENIASVGLNVGLNDDKYIRK